ncbi:hypothetical protein [Burkholderia territorii]|uniref:hypothetical protein n=1 Tax=Burkholderia territorii TaxID=1503055 RepID=UPI000A7DB1B2|nr:hypothetical protein [Burkholderia territorii]
MSTRKQVERELVIKHRRAVVADRPVFVKGSEGYNVYRAGKYLGHVKRVGTQWGIYSAAHGADVKCYGTAKTRDAAARYLSIA